MTTTCTVCGYAFKSGDIVKEVAFRSSEYETMCEMCYSQIERRNK